MKLHEHVYVLTCADGSIIRDADTRGVYLSLGVARVQARKRAYHHPVFIKQFTLTDGEVVYTEEARYEVQTQAER